MRSGGGSSTANIGPSDIDLTNQAVFDNIASGAVVGSLSVVDPDSDFWNFEILDNAKFQLSSATGSRVDLQRSATGTLVADATETVTIRAVDPRGGVVSKAFEITVAAAPAGTAPIISNQSLSVSPDAILGTVVGVLPFDNDPTLPCPREWAESVTAFGLDASTGVVTVIDTTALQALDGTTPSYAWGAENAFGSDAATAAIAVGNPTAAFITSQTIRNTSGSEALKQATRMGVVFRYGDVGASEEVIPTDANDDELPNYQWDEIATFDDGSWRHAVLSVVKDSVAAASTSQLRFQKLPGTYSAGSTSRTDAEITAQAFSILLEDVCDTTGAAFEGGGHRLDANDYIGSAGHTLTYASGPARRGRKVFGEAIRTDNDAASAHLFGGFYFDQWSDNEDPTVAHGTEFVAYIGTPWMNVSGATNLAFKASLWRDGNLVRDMSYTKTFGASDVAASTNRITITAHGIVNGELFKLSTTDTVPGGTTAAGFYAARRVDDNTITLHTSPANAIGGVGVVDLTSGGVGTHTLTKYCVLPYRTVMFFCGDDGKADWTENEPSIRMELTGTEKLYWKQSGLIPPVDLTQTYANTYTQTYRNGNTLPLRQQINGTGGTPMIGLIPAYVIQAFANQSEADQTTSRVSALTAGGAPLMFVLNDETSGGDKIARIPVMNRGADKLGTQYSGMGTCYHNKWYFSASNFSGMTNPTTGSMVTFTEPSIDGSHWPCTFLEPYLREGSRHLLDLLRFSANKYLVAGIKDTERANRTIAGVTNYGLTTCWSQPRSEPWRSREVALGSVLGGDCSEKDYLRDCIDNSLSAVLQYAAANPAWGALGFVDRDEGNNTDEASAWQYNFNTGGFAWIKKLIRTQDADDVAEMRAIITRAFWDDSLFPSFYADTIRCNFRVNPVTGNGFANSDELGVQWGDDRTGAGQMAYTVAADGTITPRAVPHAYTGTITAGDRYKKSYETRANFTEISEAAFYYAVEVDDALKTFKLSATEGGLPITPAAPTEVNLYHIAQVGPADGCLNNGTSPSADCESRIAKMAIAVAKAAGVSDMDTAYANAQHRTQGGTPTSTVQGVYTFDAETIY